MNIGIVTTWFERGAAYVSKTYRDLLILSGNDVFIFARGGESHSSTMANEWNGPYVTRSSTTSKDFYISKREIKKWILTNKLDAILFNEQRDYAIFPFLKKTFPKLLLGAYVDYYTEDTLKLYNVYDFVICNTMRHMQTMRFHKNSYYIPWGVDLELFKTSCRFLHDEVVFFHSVGMSPRKGTDILLEAFIDGKLYESSKLIIHTQVPLESVSPLSKEEASKYGIEVIEETISAPGLYYMGDVYVYPTKLDGLGLTMYEALSSGLPIITTDFPPMNEVGDETCARRIRVKDYYCRYDAYLYPMAICDKDDLIKQMNWFIDNKDQMDKMKSNARAFAEKNYNILDRAEALAEIFNKSVVHPIDKDLAKECILRFAKHRRITRKIYSIKEMLGLI